MTTPSVAVHLPQPLYHRLTRLAKLTGRPVETLVVQALSASLPPLPDDLPETMRQALVSLEALDDDRLWQIVRAMATPEQQERLVVLQEKRRQGGVTAAEMAELDELRREADLAMLRKAYAAVLLKWRGYRLPPLHELSASA